MLSFLLTYFAKKDVRDAAEKRAIFISQFNHPSAENVADEALSLAIEEAVKGQLQFPKTAAFDQIFIRKCSDEIVRGAGVVTFSGLNGVASTGGYMVEFIAERKCELLDLHSNFDPVWLKELPQPDEWDGKSIPYAKPTIPAPLAKHKADWPLRLKLCAICLIIAVVVYLFRH